MPYYNTPGTSGGGPPGPPGPPGPAGPAGLGPLKFSGSMSGTPAMFKARYLGDTPTSSYVSAPQYPVPSSTVSATLRVKPSSNSLTVATNFTVFLNGVPTAITITIPALSTAIASFTGAFISTGGVDTIDLRMDATGGGANNSISVASTIVLS